VGREREDLRTRKEDGREVELLSFVRQYVVIFQMMWHLYRVFFLQIFMGLCLKGCALESRSD
jgi:hypothetical protein